MSKKIIRLLCIFLFMGGIFSCSSYKHEKRDYWLKHQYRSVSYVDTNKLDIKVKSYVIDGAIAKQKGNYAMAIVNYMLALQYDTTAALLFALADGFHWLGNHNLAIEYAHKALLKDPNFLPCYEVLCRSYLHLNDIKNATIAVECLVKIEESEEMLYYLAGLYDYQKSPLAKEIYKKLINKYDNTAAIDKLINIEKTNNNYENAEQILYDALQNNLGNFRYAMDLINIWFMTNKTDSIVSNLDSFNANFNTDELETMYNYIIVKLTNSNVTENENRKHYEKIINKIDDRFSFSQILNYSAGNYAIKNKDTARAKTFFNNIVNAPATNPEVALMINRILADLYFNTKEYAISDSIYEKIIAETEKPDPITYNNYAYSLSIRDKDIYKAFRLSLDALSITPNSPEYLDTQGYIQYKLGKYEQAIYYLEQSLQYDNTNYEVYLHLAETYMAMDNHQYALKVIENAIELQPNNQTLLEKRNEIEKLIKK